MKEVVRLNYLTFVSYYSGFPSANQRTESFKGFVFAEDFLAIRPNYINRRVVANEITVRELFRKV